MKAVQNNPYRTLGLLVGATAREQERQVRRLKQFIEAEKDPEDDFSFPKLGKFQRKIEQVNDAASKLNLNIDKINAALFWFWNGNPITDEVAFDSLKDGDIETAYQIWDRLTIETKEDGKRFWKPVTEKNYSAFHNGFLLNLIKPNNNLHTAIVANLFFLESDLIQKFVSSVVDETYKTSKKEMQLLFLNQLYSEIAIDKIFSRDKFLEIINKQEFVAKIDFLNGLVQKPIEQIENKIEETKSKRKTSKSNAETFGRDLQKQTFENLKTLKSILGESNIKYSSIADKVSNEILQCSIDYFNYHQEENSDINYFELAYELAQSTESIAIGRLTKERIIDSLNTLEEMRFKEISQAIQVLHSIKEAYEVNKYKINKQVREMPLGYNQTINWDKVNQMIEKSLDWDKVVSVVLEVIPLNNIDKIRSVNTHEKLNEYKTLVNFLFEKLSYSQKSKIEHIRYWETLGIMAKIASWFK